MKFPQIVLSSRVKALATHDLAVFGTALLATGVLDKLLGGGVTLDVLVGAITAAVKVTLRQILPVPAAK